MTRIKHLLHSFRREEGGNVALMFGLAIIGILAAAGVALDMARARMFQSEIQEASDAAVLAAARHKSTHESASEAELTAVAWKVFDTHVRNRDSLSFAPHGWQENGFKDAIRQAIADGEDQNAGEARQKDRRQSRERERKRGRRDENFAPPDKVRRPAGRQSRRDHRSHAAP